MLKLRTRKRIEGALLAFCAVGLFSLLAWGFKSNREDRRNLIDAAALTLAIAAIVFAARQYMDSERLLALSAVQLLESKKQLIATKNIAKLIYTRYVGKFPRNLKAITSVTRHADKLRIMTDIAAYGFYSQPERFASYYETLLTKTDGKHDVLIFVYEDEAFKAEFEAQFPRDCYPEEQTKDRFKNYFKLFPPAPDSWELFQCRLFERERALRQALAGAGGVRVMPLKERVPLFCWIRDDEEAVVSFQSAGDPNDEISFRTRDPRFIDMLKKTLARFCGDPDHELRSEAPEEGTLP